VLVRPQPQGHADPVGRQKLDYLRKQVLQTSALGAYAQVLRHLHAIGAPCAERPTPCLSGPVAAAEPHNKSGQ